MSFARLMDQEDRQLEAAKRTTADPEEVLDRVVGQPGSAQEPWVAFTNRDRVGLALSGGGIRSATFNLGLLQAFRDKGVLDTIDYLSTVSGGGYVGGFWTAWRQRSTEVDPSTGQPLIFPKHTRQHTADGRTDPLKPSPKEIRERGEFRHLREFSRFLMPRVGFMNAETWNGIVAVLFGLLPSLSVTLAVIGLGLISWLVLNSLLLAESPLASATTMFLLSASFHLLMERQFWRRNGAEAEEFRARRWLWIPLLLSGFAALVMVCVKEVIEGHRQPEPMGPLPLDWVFTPGPFNPAWSVLGPVAAWLLSSGSLLMTRLLLKRGVNAHDASKLHTSLALDRSIARFLVLSLVWGTLSLLWLLAIWLMTTRSSQWNPVSMSATLAAALSAVFAWLRDWLVKPVEVSNLSTLLRRLKPILPQILAYGAVAALFVMVSQALLLIAFDAHHSVGPRLGASALACGVVISFALRFFDLDNLGLHEFYRSRIARCFLGAVNSQGLGKSADQNRQTNERTGDDFHLGEIPGAESAEIGDPTPRLSLFRPLRLRPIHLICCASNHLAGDPLANLYRGARSAVLSQHGISLANETAGLPELRISSALTASAAAFNSNMGSISMHLGLPVAFLMSAMNLRLGLWVPHPRNPKRTQRWLPGLFFFSELFSRTESNSLPPLRSRNPDDLFPPPYSRPHPSSQQDRVKRYLQRSFQAWRKRPTRLARLTRRWGAVFRWRQNSHQYLHLSDGGHFENLGLYELIRRHCRYIIISDCGADPTYSFDDLANAIRRVREDFGVEIEVDLDPIRPNKDGVAQQHLAVGVIHYDGVAGCDKGTLLLFKPVMTGNEPCDVLQYRNANQVFPQEGTGDQFYDEAQWESYHRLGEHSGHEAFRFIDDVPNRRIGSVEALFHLALERWQAGWPQQSEQFVALTERFSKLEAQVRDHAPTFLQAEFFPEVARVCPGMGQPKHEEQVKAVYFVMLVLQFMEDVWLAGKLDTQWSHPLNQGWMSYMHRWASTPSFQRWWPILKPLYSTSFRDFIRRRFGLKLKDISRQGTEAPVHSNDARLRLEPMSIAQAQKGFAWQEWTRTQSPPIPASGFMTFSYELLFPSPPEVPAPIPLQVGVAFVQIDPVAQVASWSTNQFYVPPSLEGAGFVGRFLDALIEHFRSDPKVSELRVTVLDIGQQNHAEPRPDPGSRARRRQIVDFYKSRRFSFDRTASGQTSEFNQLFRKLGR